MVRVRGDPADHDCTTRQVRECAAGDLDCCGAKSNAGVVRIGIVADPQRNLTKLGELNIVKDHARGRCDLHGSRLLAPFVAHRLEWPTAPAAVTNWIAWIL